MRKQNDPIVQQRNKLIAASYHYLHNVKRLRYDDVLKQLSKELFFLSEQRIGKILRMKEQVEILDFLKGKSLNQPDLILTFKKVKKQLKLEL